MAHVIDSHVSVDAVRSELVGHDPASGAVDQDVETVCGVCDLFCDARDGFPVAHVGLEEFDFGGVRGTQSGSYV